jgi:hypothetical protein
MTPHPIPPDRLPHRRLPVALDDADRLAGPDPESAKLIARTVRIRPKRARAP